MSKVRTVNHKSAECVSKKTMEQEKLELELHSLRWFLGEISCLWIQCFISSLLSHSFSRGQGCQKVLASPSLPLLLQSISACISHNFRHSSGRRAAEPGQEGCWLCTGPFILCFRWMSNGCRILWWWNLKQEAYVGPTPEPWALTQFTRDSCLVLSIQAQL